MDRGVINMLIFYCHYCNEMLKAATTKARIRS